MYNFIYINTHDTGRCISPYGYDTPTPALKDFANDATLFTHAYACGPTCSPSRAAMLTGTFPHQNGMLGLAQRGFSLNDNDKHLAMYLSKHGYHTAISGIQHEVGWYLDLDENELHNLGYQDVLTIDSKPYKKEDLYIWDRNNALAAIEWLKNIKEPFALSYGMHSTHRPYPFVVNEEINVNNVKPLNPLDSNKQTRLDQAKFMTSAKNADDNVDLIINALKENGLYDNTIIMYTTDHGVANPFHKCNLKDDGIGVSLIIRHPNMGKGEVYDNLISHIDIYPTILELLGLEIPSYVCGKSYAKIFENTELEIDQEIYAEVNFHTSYEPMRCIRNKRYKYIRYYDNNWNKLNLSNIDESLSKDFLMQNDLEKIIKPTEALYDLYYDRHEVNNLIGDSRYQNILEEGIK